MVSACGNNTATGTGQSAAPPAAPPAAQEPTSTVPSTATPTTKQTVSVYGQQYTCDQLIGGTCDSNYQYDFNKWGDKMQSFIMASNDYSSLAHIEQQAKARLGFFACEIIERGQGIDSYVKPVQNDYPEIPASNLTDMFNVAQQRLCAVKYGDRVVP
ncbi:hypothetical protein G9E11_15325 [Arthrobacter sp. IA7]|uniref:hypothetical protein n=1 Tax=Arthrobacter ipis TaxID=2716202 RepID=UPI001686BC87|nr:hypothetical protein [Arthrobacter ipis]MBD1543582.1 hypothetical protein [Arthrobacter ipis]